LPSLPNASQPCESVTFGLWSVVLAVEICQSPE